jgi:polysaccharide export outer membrane protein
MRRYEPISATDLFHISSRMRIPRGLVVAVVCAVICAFCCVTAPAQSTPAGTVAPNPALSSSNTEYTVGPGDVIIVSVPEAQEFGGKIRVSDSGLIEIAGLSSPISAEGQSPMQLAQTIRQSLIDAKQLRDPKVTVFVEEFHGRRITVLGAVAKPSVYPMERRTTVLDALSMAGGALPGAGNTVTIVRGAASAESTGTPLGSVQIIDMSRLVKGEDPAANVEVQNGDVVNVSAAQVVYVVGAVNKPGGFVMSNPSAGISVVQALAMAEGFNSVASTNRGVIIRQSTSETARQEIPVDLSHMLSGKSTDVLLAPNDILYIPESGARKALKAMVEIAMSAANGVAIYGVGYRAAGLSP